MIPSQLCVYMLYLYAYMCVGVQTKSIRRAERISRNTRIFANTYKHYYNSGCNRNCTYTHTLKLKGHFTIEHEH